MQSWAGSMHPSAVMLRLVIFVLTATSLLAPILAQPDDIARETDWSKPDRPKIDGSFVKPRKFLAWVATSAARGRLEVLFIEQKSLREQLTEILQEADDYTWTEEGLANFSIKISRKGQGLETTYSILPKVRKVPAKIVDQWKTKKGTLSGFLISLKARILLMASKLTLKVYLRVARTKGVQLYYPKLQNRKPMMTTNSDHD